MLDALTDFRLYYMRFLADSWAANRFSTQAELDNQINSQAKGLMDWLLNTYGYVSPWENIRVEMIVPPNPAAVKWNPLDTAGWICPNDYFIINLPRLPEGINPNDQVSALAAYYQQFPTLLGLSNAVAGGGDGAVIAGAIAPLGIDPGPFLEFGGITLRALALAWKDNNFLNELAAPAGAEDATPVLSKWLGFTNQWNFKLQFIFNNTFQWNGRDWVNIPRNIVRMHFPTRPTESPEYWPIALTSYNNTGPAYPFTC